MIRKIKGSSKKPLIFGMAAIGMVGTSIGITIPFVISQSDESNKKEKKENVFPTINNKDKFNNLTKEIIYLNSLSEVNLSNEKTQDEILNIIKSKASFLSKSSIDSISLNSLVGKIDFYEPLNILIKINIDSVWSFHTFKVNVGKNSKNRQKIIFNNLISKINKLPSKLEINFNENLDVANIIKNKALLKKLIIEKIESFSNKAISDFEKKLISIETNKIISNNELKTKLIILWKEFKNERIISLSKAKSHIDKLNILKSKIEKITSKKLILNEDVNLDLNNFSDKEKIKTKIFDEINTANTIKLVDYEKEAINILSEDKIVTQLKTITINIFILFGKEKINYVLKIIRIPTKDEILESTTKKIDKIIGTNFILNEKRDYNLNNSNDREIIKNKIVTLVNSVNIGNELLDNEINIINIPLVNQKITHSIRENVMISILAGSHKVYYFSFSRPISEDESNQIKFNNIKNKFDRIAPFDYILSDQKDINLAINKNIVKQFIFNTIDKINPSKILTNEEKQAISLVTSSGIITHTNSTNVSVAITFGTNIKIYSLKITRTISNDEKFNNLKSKIDNYIKKQGQRFPFLNPSIINLSSSTNRNKIKNIIVYYIKQNYTLNAEEMNGMIIKTTSGIVRTDRYLDIIVKFSIANHEFEQIFKVMRSKSNSEIEKEKFEIFKKALDSYYVEKYITLDTQKNFNLRDQTQKSKLINKIADSIESAIFHLDYDNDYWQKDIWINNISIVNYNTNISTTYSTIKIKIKFSDNEEIFKFKVNRK